MTTQVTVRDAPDSSRLEAVLPDGRVAGFAHYEAGPAAYVFDHTVVDDEFEGQGVGGQLARGVVSYARERAVSIDPTCSFLRAHLARHPEDQDVLSDGVQLG